ncbi:hypothetical protein SAMN04488058_12116 [Deinococcus reticulitermitis]|uniref:Intracellular proteinase inhibitor n=1 Tax=Deinococcus reticulitermitis TaxID=856736 RepID=A0A1H7C8D4_9DEIO|nr:hypothetical protein [Deinococcus reticulitermitis]SEJ82860.1 hypothetical protein SAMN04488058_12116 [Deinococcus reticulitermitis]
MRRRLALLLALLGTAATAAPRLSLSVPDAAAGWAVDYETNHFAFVTVLNPSPAPVQLTCRSHGGPVVRLLREASGRLEEVTTQPLSGAPICTRLGQTVTLAPGKGYMYRAPLGTHLTADRYQALAFWRVEGNTGGILRSAQSPAFTVRPAPPAPPLPEQVKRELQDAVGATGVRVFSGSVRRGQLVLSVGDEAARGAILREVRRRGLPERFLRIEVALPVRLPTVPLPAGVRTRLDVTEKGGTYTFALKITNTGQRPLTASGGVCHPAIIERIEGGARVWQTGNGLCPDLGWGLRLAPGQSHTERLSWDGRTGGREKVPPGTYRVRMAVAGLLGEKAFEVRR